MDRKRFTIISVTLASVVVIGLIIGMVTKKEESKVNIGKSDICIEDGVLTPEVLWSMGRIGGVTVSPDGSRIGWSSILSKTAL